MPISYTKRVHKIDDATLVELLLKLLDLFEDFNPDAHVSFLPGLNTDVREVSNNIELVGSYA